MVSRPVRRYDENHTCIAPIVKLREPSSDDVPNFGIFRLRHPAFVFHEMQQQLRRIPSGIVHCWRKGHTLGVCVCVCQLSPLNQRRKSLKHLHLMIAGCIRYHKIQPRRRHCMDTNTTLSPFHRQSFGFTSICEWCPEPHTWFVSVADIFYYVVCVIIYTTRKSCRSQNSRVLRQLRRKPSVCIAVRKHTHA